MASKAMKRENAAAREIVKPSPPITGMVVMHGILLCHGSKHRRRVRQRGAPPPDRDPSWQWRGNRRADIGARDL